jgi:MFS family permease
LSRDLVTNALALNATAMSGTTLLAPAIAGNLYNILGPGGLYYVISSLQLGSVLLMGLIKFNEAASGKKKPAMIGEIKAGILYIRRNHIVLILLVMALVTTVLAMPIRHLLPLYVVDIYQRGPEAFGLLLSAIGIGALAGSLVMAAAGKWHRGILLILGGILSGISLLLLALFPLYLVALGMMFLVGLGDSARRTLVVAMLLEVADEEYRGRVSSVYTLNYGLIPIGTLSASIISQYFGVRPATATLGILLLVICLAILATQKSLRRMK